MNTTSPVAVDRRAFTIKEFCDAYRVGRTRAWQLVKDGDILARTIGRRVLIDAAAAERWYVDLPSNSGRAGR